MKKNILVIDDEKNALKKYYQKLINLELVAKRYEVNLLNNEELIKEITILNNRKNGKIDIISSKFDDMDILIIDYDLLNSDSYSFITGEVVAYLARSFSKCGLIIGINQFGYNNFDLTLKGHIDSYCDLNIGGEQIDNPNLWGGTGNVFKPWYWPNLDISLTKLDKKIKEVSDNIDKPILEILKLQDYMKYFSKDVLSFLKGNPSKITFDQFVLKSGNGLKKPTKKKPSIETISRIGAARISKWLERIILPGQDILVDAPHLVHRYPSLLNGDINDVSIWNILSSFNYDEINIKHKYLTGCKYEKDNWVSRPVWNWVDIINSEKILEIKTPWKRKEVDFVFCEDTSTFEKEEDTKKFIIDSSSPFIQRYIKKITGVQYGPAIRLMV